MKNKSILIIGGAGYIGTVLTDHLLSAGYKVTCLDLLLYQNNIGIMSYLGNPNYKFIYGDMNDQDILETALTGITDVVLLAGLVGDLITKHYPVEAEAINDHGTMNCIDRLNGHGLDSVIFTSSCSNYGLIDSTDVADENYPLGPTSLYAKSKVAIEQYLLSKQGQVDYKPTILRFATAFGLSPRMRFDLTISDFTRGATLREEVLVFGLHTWRPYCHVRDFARLIELVINAPADKVAFEIFNGGGDVNNYTKQGIVDIILALVPDANIKYQDQITDPRNYRVDFTKVKTVLGFEPAYTVEHGVQELFTALNNHVFDYTDLAKNYFGNNKITYNIIE